MTVMNGVLGTWNCTSQVPAFGSKPAYTDRTTLTFEAAPGNVVRDHVAGSDFVGDDYFGYSDQSHSYWNASADSSGMHGSATSNDGMTHIGTSQMGSASLDSTTTFKMTDASHFTLHSAMASHGHAFAIDTLCSR
jgi:hypothetical protein